MKRTLLMLFATLALTGCMARKIVTVPAGIAVKATANTTGNVAGGTVKAILPDGEKSP